MASLMTSRDGPMPAAQATAPAVFVARCGNRFMLARARSPDALPRFEP
jgi:hypothetical protein